MSIYRSLRKACGTSDQHDDKIRSQKKSFAALAVKWAADGSISNFEQQEIAALLKRATFADWRPLIYIIPYALVKARVQPVAQQQRASLEPEFIIKDLHRDEFDIIEVES